MATPFNQDLYEMQWAFNLHLAAGLDEVRRSDIRSWFDSAADQVFLALKQWESQGFIAIVADPRSCKDEDVCVRICRKFE